MTTDTREPKTSSKTASAKKPAKLKLSAVASLCIESAEQELAYYGAQLPQHTEQVRKLSERVDGARYAKAVIYDEGLKDKSDKASRLEAIHILRIAGQTAAMCYKDGFCEGIHLVRIGVVRMIEGKNPLPTR